MGTPTKTVAYAYGDSQWGDLLTGYNGKNITYDAIGNPLSDGTWTYTWQHGRQLASMSDGTTTWTYTYDADGLRTQRTNGSTTYNYAYVDGQLVKMTRGSTELAFAYDAEGRPLTVRYNDLYYFYVTNMQGDVIGIVRPDGTQVVSYTYDAWGNLLAMSGSEASTIGTLNPLRYRSYVYDTETGLYYLQSRYYNPEIGRFINADGQISDVGGEFLGYNQFAYCFNNPVNMDDNTGNWPRWITAAVTVVAAVVTVAAVATGFRGCSSCS